MIGDDVRPPVTEPVRAARHGVDAVGWTEATVATTQRYDQNPIFPVTFTVALVPIALAGVLQRPHANHRHPVPGATGHSCAPPAGDSARRALDRQVDSHAGTART